MTEQTDIPAEYAWLLELDAQDVLASIQTRLPRELIPLIGLEATLKLLFAYEGQPVYVPKLEQTFIKLRDERIRREFNGANHAALAKRYGLSVRHIYEIARNRQADLFAEAGG